MPLITNDDAARRLARAIASDIALYHEDKVLRGITDDNLFELLEQEISDGERLYSRRVDPSLHAKNYFKRALVDVIVRSKGHVASKLW